ncbi:MAG: glutaredoxin family protein [Steroidobacteraceae bacterium]
MIVNLELFYSPYCSRCHKARQQLRALTTAWPDGELVLREHDVVKALARAVAVGVRATPALAIDGELLAGPVPSPRALRALIRQQMNGRKSS